MSENIGDKKRVGDEWRMCNCGGGAEWKGEWEDGVTTAREGGCVSMMREYMVAARVGEVLRYRLLARFLRRYWCQVLSIVTHVR